MNKLSDMAGKFDDLMKERALRMIRKFAISRHQANCIDKKTAARRFVEVLKALYVKKMS